MKVTICLTTVLVTLAGGCSDTQSTGIAPSVSPQQQASVSQSMGLSFPDAARFLLYRRASESGSRLPAPDDSVHLMIELTPSDLNMFLAQQPFSEASWSTTNRWVSDDSQWAERKPSSVQNYRSEQFQLSNGSALNVLIDDDREDTKVVYLFWIET